MKKYSCLFILGFLAGYSLQAQTRQNAALRAGQTLLWRVSGNGLARPSYLFGTIHALCKEDARLGDSIVKLLEKVAAVYFEADLDSPSELSGVMEKMNMKDGQSLRTLLNADDYEKIEKYFGEVMGPVAFSMVEHYKPMLLASMVQVKSLGCTETVAVEQLIMKECKRFGKEIRGLETMEFQASVFDSIPYEVQAKQLLDVVNGVYDVDDEMARLMKAYRQQDMKTIEKITLDEKWGLGDYMNLIVLNRNKSWMSTLADVFAREPVLVAVGAGHLPGKSGLVSLLRSRGYRVEPLGNDLWK